MGSSIRTKKVASVLREELSQILQFKLSDPRITAAGIVTISYIKLAPDHRNATVYLSFLLPSLSPKIKSEAIKSFEKASGFVYRILVKRLQMRTVPHLCFRLDDNFDSAAKIQSLLNTIDQTDSIPANQ